MLQHKVTRKIRVLMRRDKTHKICANHLITSDIALQPNVGSDRSWVYNTLADFSEGEQRAETFAIRFANTESIQINVDANKFKDAFEDAQKKNAALDKKEESKESDDKKVTESTETKEESKE